MAIYNENYLIELFGFNKNNKKYEKKDNKTKNSSQPTPVNFTQEDIKYIGSKLKKIVNDFNKDPNNKKAILEALEKYYDEVGVYNEYDYHNKSDFVKFVPFTCKLIKNNNSELAYEVCHKDQDYLYAISDFIIDIGDELEDFLDEYSKKLEDSIIKCVLDFDDANDGIIAIIKYKTPIEV